MMTMQTPVVFIIFNRAETARRVLGAIREARPRRLLVIADGPRPGRAGEAERCATARAVIDEVDWECEVLTNYSQTNLGCRRRVSSGLDWVFSLVAEAIIIEDDCLPHPDFFPFCEAMLERYRDDQRIMHIAGTNYQFGRRQFEQRQSPYSYYFSRYNHCWGWATWRRAWQHYDRDLTLWPMVRDRGLLADLLEGDRRAITYWTRSFEATSSGKIDSWSYVWTLSCWSQSGLTILPAINLISNIGFDDGASNTLNRRSRFASMKTAPLGFPLNPPPFVIRDALADRYTQRHNFRHGWLRDIARSLLRSMLKSR